MRRISVLLAALAVAALALSPGLADARAGGGGSFGSRGGMTYSAPPSTNTAPYSASPMQRSMTPRYQPSPGYASPGFQRSGSGFMSGLMGGLIGAGIGGMLFGHGFMGGGLGMFGFLGLLLQIFLVVVVVRFLFRTFMASRAPQTAGGPNMFGRGAMPGAGPTPAGGRASGPPPIAIGQTDYQQFEQLLKGIQAAWSAHDLNGLQAMTTPEMVNYFAEQLTEQVSRGVRTVVDDVTLVSGDLSQAWTEQGRDYATVAMRFSMVDVTRDATGRVVDGSPDEHVTATEIWTFVRSHGGHWILSAIQQAR
ncbi:Tim44 domain-containing protein [Rhodopila sp.]|uniref:Tim44 domain-containing protein n=1 Tax=Rhodopila sp. TaxID=2480087 RepID=UPI003D0C01F0